MADLKRRPRFLIVMGVRGCGKSSVGRPVGKPGQSSKSQHPERASPVSTFGGVQVRRLET